MFDLTRNIILLIHWINNKRLKMSMFCGNFTLSGNLPTHLPPFPIKMLSCIRRNTINKFSNNLSQRWDDFPKRIQCKPSNISIKKKKSIYTKRLWNNHQAIWVIWRRNCWKRLKLKRPTRRNNVFILTYRSICLQLISPSKGYLVRHYWKTQAQSYKAKFDFIEVNSWLCFIKDKFNSERDQGSGVSEFIWGLMVNVILNNLTMKIIKDHNYNLTYK